MKCKWCNNKLNGANEYQLLGYCNVGCRMRGGDSDKIDLEAEKSAAPNVVIVHENPPVVVQEKKIKKQKPQDVIPSLDSFFSKKVLKDQ